MGWRVSCESAAPNTLLLAFIAHRIRTSRQAQPAAKRLRDRGRDLDPSVGPVGRSKQGDTACGET
jgi:hypothetical protein